MRFSIFGAFTALAALATAHTAPDYSQGPTGNPIYTPGLNEAVPVGKPYSITWGPTTEGTVSLVLLRGESTNMQTLETIAEQIPNNGKFEWTPSTSLEADVTHYGLLLVVEGTGQYQYSTQFGISNPNGGASSSSSSAAPEVPTSTAANTDAPSSSATSYVTYEITTTICPETETAPATVAPTASTSAPVIPPPAQSHSWGTGGVSIPVVSPTNTPYLPTTLRSTAAPSGTASSTTPGVPLFTSGADRNAISFGAAAAGVLAVLAF
ncbi:extracellular serine-threonine rich protein [Aspergillus nomiae NRRL 13137]|uniref:Extracellular serine-threonine rich protein n=1 Tax=Aspergillus nomiae NRRL (strain ATCC 15546 / NRRL 13137 / CBS 260.88 / M93) TaxID=1509407 RepID=A0A0L1INB8_ASPN3|nr:extracellular serine-threonine rich protein [Aspergillus nomiae NRRL 13137]KNG81081.1 extracellular serine-threonine rich protein [Aspergillus nomiae NRRL 13137]